MPRGQIAWLLLCLPVTTACRPETAQEPSPVRDPRPAAAPAQTPTAPSPAPTVTVGTPADGKALYAAHCAVCHGAEGRGDGAAAWLLWPRPRDFSRGLFKIRTTPSGALPTDDDLLQVITDGMPGSSMPAWRHLSAPERLALVGQVKALSQFHDEDEGRMYNFFTEKARPAPIPVPPEPPATPETIVRGRTVYLKQDCVKCHGDAGRGDGLAAAGLKDDWGHPLRPNDFTRGIFKGGSAGVDIYRRFSTGMNGTPMPQFGPELMTDEERWCLVHYVKSLSKGGLEEIARALPPGEAIPVRRVDPAALPPDPADAAWERIPAVTAPLQLLFQRASAPRTLQIRAAHDGRRLALRLSWEDSGVDGTSLRPEDFRDAAAVQFALKGMDTPSLMGGPGKPVNLWHWKADWQSDLGRYHDIEDIHPGMVNEWYPFQRGDPTNDRGSRPASAPSHDRAFLTGWAAGNAFSNPHRRSPVEDLAAQGFGTLTSLPSDKQAVEGRGVWIGGRWSVQISRAFAPPDPCCAAFSPGLEIPASFAVWDGASGDRNGQKSVTMWYRLKLEE
jgi:mono/diheme cytochrome c family protein